MRYRPEIDGLRAVAVVPVILYHAGFEYFRNGFVGVDIFFVISGYLITSIIVNDLEANSFSLVDFYSRRAKRILPALYFIALACVPAAWMLLGPTDAQSFAKSLAAMATFTSNFYFWNESDYFATDAEFMPLLHTWSLAVEEQFYILYPLFLIAIWRFGKRVIVTLILTVLIASLFAAQSLVVPHPAAAFYLLPTRAWELLLGALCALYVTACDPDQPGRFDQILSIIGGVAISLAITGIGATTTNPIMWTLLATLGAAMTILFSRPGTWTCALLSTSPFTRIGLISYSAYLWHQPLFAFARSTSIEEPPALIMLLLSVILMPLSWLTWKFIETPFRTSTVPRRTVLFRSLSATVLVLAVGMIGAIGTGYPNSGWAMRSGDWNNLNWFWIEPTPSNRELGEQSWDNLRQLTGQPEYFILNNPHDETLWFDEEDQRINLLIVGNSHSKDLFNLLWYSEHARRTFEVGRYGVQIGMIRSNHPFFASPNYIEADWIMIASRMQDYRSDADRLEDVIDRMLNDGKNVAITTSVYEFPLYRGGDLTLFDRIVFECLDDPSLSAEDIAHLANTEHYRVYRADTQTNDVTRANAKIKRLATAFPRLVVLDRMDYLCDDDNAICHSTDAQLTKFLYGNGHITLDGAQFLAQRIDEINWLAPLQD